MPRRRKERGALMVALMAGLAIMMILSAVAVQKWADVVRRDNEAEMMFRAQDIVRALRRYQKDQGKLPNELKDLREPGTKGQYFIRHLWKDPLVKGGKWQLLYAAPGGGLFDPSAAPPPDGSNPTTTAQTPFGGGQSLGSPLAGTQLPNQNSGGIPDIIHHDDGTSDVTGLPIAGVKTRSTDMPFRRYRDKDQYKDWVFSIFDQQTTPAPGQAPNPGQTGAPNPSNNGQNLGQQQGGSASFPPR